MNTPLNRIRFGATVFGSIVLVAVVGYRLSGRSWLDAVYMVVITISSVGYGEKTGITDPTLKLFTIGAIIFGMCAAGYTIGGFLQMMTEGELERALGRRRTAKGIEQLKGHAIVCGFGRTGQILAAELERQNIEFVVIDDDAERIADAVSRGYLTVIGDAAEEENLIAAGVERAKSLITGLPDDVVNVFLTLTSRNLNPKLQIIARVENPSAEKKLIQAGADRVVLPAVIGAHRMAWLVAKPSSAAVMESFTDQNVLDVDMGEATIPATSKLVGLSVRNTEAHRFHRLLFVAIRQADHRMVFNPDADYTFNAGDTIIIMGRMEGMQRFRQEYGL